MTFRPTYRFLLLAFLIGFFILPFSKVNYAQTSEVQFGQNRVQYHDFEWSFYESENFNTYFYIGGQDLGKFSILAAEKYLQEIVDKLDFQPGKKMEIIVYSDITDLNMSNIGIFGDITNIGGTTTIIGNKIFVYYNGNHNDMLSQIKEGIARLFLEKMMVGGSFQEVVQNAVLLNLPEWYVEGLISYISKDWNSEMEDKLRDGFSRAQFTQLNNLTKEELKLVGHSIWQYLEQQYGENAIPNLAYLTRINRSIESGFLFVTGANVNDNLNNWYQFYSQKFKTEAKGKESNAFETPIRKKEKKNRTYYEVKVSPDGRYIAYASNVLGQIRVHLYDHKFRQEKKILKEGFKTETQATDLSYPLIDFDPKSRELAIIYETRDKIKLMTYNLRSEKKKVSSITKFQKVFDFAYSYNEKNLIISGMQKAQCDLFTYYIPTTKVKQITNDFYDDLDPAYIEVNGQRGFMFASNRTSDTMQTEKLDTTLPIGQFDLFFYSLSSRSKKLIRVTETPLANETNPHQFSKSHYSFISDGSGIKNRFLGKFESTYSHTNKVFATYDRINKVRDTLSVPEWQSIDSLVNYDKFNVQYITTEKIYETKGKNFPVTNYIGNLVSFDIAEKEQLILNNFLERGKLKFYREKLDTSAIKKKKLEDIAFVTLMKTQQQDQAINVKKPESKNKDEDPELPIQIEEKPAYFYTDFYGDYNTFPSEEELETNGFRSEANNSSEDVFSFSKVRPYFTKFSADQIVAQLDNSLIETTYQKFQPGIPAYETPPLSPFFKLGITDLFEDHKIYGGIRPSFNFTETEFFLSYLNLKKRLDKKFTYYRRSNSNESSGRLPFVDPSIRATMLNPIEYVVKTNYLETQLTYPLDVTKSVRLGLVFRNDKYVYKASSDISLNLPNYNDNWVFARLEFVQDNTLDKGLNLKNGLRYKAFAEIHKNIPTRKDTLFGNVNLALPQLNDQYFGVFGLDVRHYQKLHRQLIWANRVAFASSFGNNKIIYYLGGVDSWLGAQFNDDTPINSNNNYAFQALATNLRGHDQNIRNGNSYAVINSEIRFPIFSYLIKKPISSRLIKNFQIVPFFDVGSAWEGRSPYKKDNPIFVETISNSAITVRLDANKNPIVAGYGFGLRTVLLGFFVRTDLAWGIDSGESKGPSLLFSLTTDF